MVFYFSGTGNTKWAATQLALSLGDDMTDMASALYAEGLSGNIDYTLAPDERIGFCFPIHGWQPPHIVRQFLSKMRLHGTSSDSYCYVLCTCGDNTGEAMRIFASDLASRGLHLDAAFSLVMPETYVALPFMLTDTIEREREKRRQAEADLQRFATLVEQRSRGEEHLVKGTAPWLLTYVVGAYFNKFMITDSKFTSDPALCTGCGQCARSCPVGDICMAEGRPQWKHDKRCTSCLACYHHCPHHAINYGSITRRRGQYYFGRNDNIILDNK